MQAYDDLMAFQRQTEALSQVAGRLGWDQETMMPSGAAAQRSEEMGAMESVLHARRSAPQIGAWLAALDGAALDPVARAQVAEIRRGFVRAQAVPEALAARIARVTSMAQGKWAEARANDDVASFVPVLAEVIALRQEEGAAMAAAGIGVRDGQGDAYDALLQDYEPGSSAAELDEMFGALRPRLSALRAAVLEQAPPKGVSGPFDAHKQVALARRMAEGFGYDLSRGRLDKAVHPFSSGSGNDVRITTRTSESDPFNCLYSTIHEVGHATYEQNIDQAYLLSPLGRGVSMGVHESQSRILENQLGRSAAYAHWLFERMTETFGDIGVPDATGLYAAVNEVKRGYIRTEADEVQYNLHVLLRFDLERDLISGKLQAADLEAAWNARFEADFGYAVDRPSNGCLQDVHWSVGLFGYFATYTLGNVYAGCLHQAMRAALPGLDDDMRRGDLSGASAWLAETLQRHGGLRGPRETIEAACGFAPSEGPLLDYLDAKFTALYSL